MKPAAFEYERPNDIAGALALAARSDIAVRFLAGGQSLGPMLNLRLAQPDLVIDLTGIAELKHVGEAAGTLEIGACVTHADIEDGRLPDVTNGALAAVARGIAYRAVRNRGTIGGSLAHADPAADWIVFLAALGAEIVVRGPTGQRTVPAGEFMTGIFETAMAPNELLQAIRIPHSSRDARWGYYKACRKTGEFAYASSAVLHDPARGVCRAVIGAVEPRPIVLDDARSLMGKTSAAHVAQQALEAAGVADSIDRQMHVVALQRALEQAAAR